MFGLFFILIVRLGYKIIIWFEVYYCGLTGWSYHWLGAKWVYSPNQSAPLVYIITVLPEFCRLKSFQPSDFLVSAGCSNGAVVEHCTANFQVASFNVCVCRMFYHRNAKQPKSTQLLISPPYSVPEYETKTSVCLFVPVFLVMLMLILFSLRLVTSDCTCSSLAVVIQK